MRKKRNFYISMFLLSLLLVIMPIVSSAGLCELDKNNYHPDETATFNCYCSNYNEQYQNGYIVWTNSTGYAFSSELVNSGNCKRNLFSSKIIVNNSYDNNSYAIFSANADGTGIPSNWGGSGDVNNDSFNVSGGGIYDCIIHSIVGNPNIQVGGFGAAKIEVKDAITGLPLIHASCHAEAWNSQLKPMVKNPIETGEDSFVFSNSEGEAVFTRQLSENLWETNTTYVWEFHCFSLPNTTITNPNRISWYPNGSIVGMRTCTVQAVFSTGEDDLRGLSDFEMYSYIFLSLLLILASGVLFNLSLKVDYDRWYKSIQTKYQNKNIIKVGLSSIGYTFVKESFMTIYMLILPVVIMMNDLVGLANISSISSIINTFTTIYTLGMLIVIIMFFGKIQEFITTMIDYTKNEQWGLN